MPVGPSAGAILGPMADSPSPEGPDARDDGSEANDGTPMRGLRFALVVGVVLAFLGIWIYILFVYKPTKQIDELTDRRFPVAAEKICKATMDQVAALPIASMAANPKERGDTVATANAELTKMVEQLKGVQPTGDSAEDKGTREWVGDWANHLKDRAAYAEELQSGKDARFLESTKGTRQLSRAIDAFAQVNRMPSCETPQDVG